MERAKKADKPFFLWWNSTRMHIFTHLKAESRARPGLGIYADGMVEHDGHVGQVLAKLKELGLDENTIVMYSTDNGAETFTWPDGGTTMFRGEKNTNWEGGYRVPTLIKWPGVIKPGTVINDIGAHEDMLPTLLAAAGDKTATADLLKGRKIGKLPLQGPPRRLRPRPGLRGEAAWPRKEFIYWTDDGSVAALRYDNWKVTFLEQEAEGLKVWQNPFTELRAPKLTNLRMDPFERAEHENAIGYQQWYHGPHVRYRSGRRLRRPVAAELQGVSAAPEARQLQPGAGDGVGDEQRREAVDSLQGRACREACAAFLSFRE
jgi:arylsulfatase A-like enzyme